MTPRELFDKYSTRILLMPMDALIHFVWTEAQNAKDAADEQDRIDAERYRKLRMHMSMNQKETWEECEDLAAVGCYTDPEEFDLYLDHIKNPIWTEMKIKEQFGPFATLMPQDHQ